MLRLLILRDHWLRASGRFSEGLLFLISLDCLQPYRLFSLSISLLAWEFNLSTYTRAMINLVKYNETRLINHPTCLCNRLNPQQSRYALDSV